MKFYNPYIIDWVSQFLLQQQKLSAQDVAGERSGKWKGKPTLEYVSCNILRQIITNSILQFTKKWTDYTFNSLTFTAVKMDGF